METPNSGCPTWLINVYGAVLYLYPTSFRENYREQMLQVFTDNYQRRQKTNAALFYFDTISDLGNSMSQEHFSDFSKNGRIKLAMIGVFFALGFLTLKPFLTTSLSNAFDSVANIDNKISDYVYEDHSDYGKKLAQGLLLSNDPIKTMSAATHLNAWNQFYASEGQNSQLYDLKTPVARALEKNANNANVWLAAYPLCVVDKQTCDANKVFNHLQMIAPENGMPLLYRASEARERGDINSQEMYLNKANNRLFFDDGKNAINASWLFAYAEQPYSLPWYSFLASKNLKKLETSAWAFDSYFQGCRDAHKSSAAIQTSCREIARKIALQANSSLSLKLQTHSLAVRLGDTDASSNAMLELLQEQNSGYYHYLIINETKDMKALAKAYEQERQYEYAAKIAEANKQKQYPDIYAF